jgi:hypothetical protein
MLSTFGYLIFAIFNSTFSSLATSVFDRVNHSLSVTRLFFIFLYLCRDSTAGAYFMGLGVDGHNRSASYPDGVQWKWNANKGGEHQVREEDARAHTHTHTHTCVHAYTHTHLTHANTSRTHSRTRARFSFGPVL